MGCWALSQVWGRGGTVPCDHLNDTQKSMTRQSHAVCGETGAPRPHRVPRHGASKGQFLSSSRGDRERVVPRARDITSCPGETADTSVCPSRREAVPLCPGRDPRVPAFQLGHQKAGWDPTAKGWALSQEQNVPERPRATSSLSRTQQESLLPGRVGRECGWRKQRREQPRALGTAPFLEASPGHAPVWGSVAGAGLVSPALLLRAEWGAGVG